MVEKKGIRIRDLIANVSPILINPSGSAITIGLSRRFFIFRLIKQLARKIEDDPYLNFISVLKSYKILGKILYGTLYELHRDRNKLYFKNFFVDRKLYNLVKDELDWVYYKDPKYKDIKLTITKRGVLIFDNYKPNNFNVLLTTIHSGTWMRKDIQEKQTLTEEERLLEEDIDTDKIYSNLVLEKGGIWIDNKASRFACDYNREPARAIYSNRQEKWIDKIWKEDLTQQQRRWLMEGYYEFYFTLGKLIDTYRFNIIFDGHSMKHVRGRPDLSFGTLYIPKFYMPIVKMMQKKLHKDGYEKIALNVPYKGGYILKWLSEQFPDVFICSMEVNKKIYMTRTRKKTVQKKLGNVSKAITDMFEIGDDLHENLDQQFVIK